MHARHEIVVAMHVADEEGYARYRRAITPLLDALGGEFRYDFEVSRVLQGEYRRANRVFVLSFPNAEARRLLFADPAYKRARESHFERSVAWWEVLAEADS